MACVSTRAASPVARGLRASAGHLSSPTPATTIPPYTHPCTADEDETGCRGEATKNRVTTLPPIDARRRRRVVRVNSGLRPAVGPGISRYFPALEHKDGEAEATSQRGHRTRCGLMGGASLGTTHMLLESREESILNCNSLMSLDNPLHYTNCA